MATVTNTAGTPAYQAPEMLRDEPITEKVDVYSFAVLIWEIYTGKLPWSDKSCAQMVHTVAITHSRPPIPADCPKVQPPLPTASGSAFAVCPPHSSCAEAGRADDQVLGTGARGAPCISRGASHAQRNSRGAQVHRFGY